MNKFIVKSACFVSPFLLSFVAFYYFGSVEKGDLLRMGNLFDQTQKYRTIFEKDFSQKVEYTKLSHVTNEQSFDVLTIGDSFSQQQAYGYQNYLSKEESVKVLHYDEPVSGIQTLHSILNGDLFDKIKIKYVLIQCVERKIVSNVNNLDKQKIIRLNDFKENHTFESYKTASLKLFAKSTIRFPFYNLFYLFNERAYFSKVYKVKTTMDFFSTGKKELLFYSDDLRFLSRNNDESKVRLLNDELNSLALKLEKRNIQLIVLPSPDKFDIYYDYIEHKESYPRPLFFDIMSKQEKNYIYIDTKQVINNALEDINDLYFYDDTHWSPIASKLMAKEIHKEITKNSMKTALPAMHAE